jgi:tetratricopeptide (TPR) repeat protein
MTGRNDPCPCGSGKRYKHCHGSGESPDALARQGVEAHRRNDVAAAEGLYRQALALAPAHPLALHYLGVALYQQKRLEEAIPLLDKAVQLVPQEPEFHNNRGLALAASLRDPEAIDAYRRALAINPSHAGAWSNLGLALQASGDIGGAIDSFGKGLAVAPDFPQLHWNLALALLLIGDYEQGWREYEWRLRTPELAAQLRTFAGPRWSGDDPSGRIILVTAEQGLGDTIQFLRFASALADRGARVITAVPSPLRNLASTVRGVEKSIALDDPLPPYDAYVPLMSLPHMLGAGLDSVASGHYLHADPMPLPHDAKNVGIAWAGAPENTLNTRRSVALARLAPLFELSGVRLYTLQRDGEAMTPTDLPWNEQLVAVPGRDNFDTMASLVASLDLVISVDTSLAHLAGALGKRVFVLLSFVPDWRWMLARSDSPWYPTARLFRQTSPGDWASAIESAAAALREELG